jgi:ABC-2 type transport system permease protein
VSLTRTLRVLRKDVQIGPRSPVFLWVLLLPLLITFVLQVAFGSLFDPQPRLGIVDQGASSIPAAVEALDGIELSLFDDPQLLRERVESNDLDAGLVLPEGFDDAVRDGAEPALQFFVGGRSLASNRVILSVTTIDLVRAVEGRTAPVDVRVVALGEDVRPLAVRLVPFITMYALLIAGVFLPSFSIADEREKHTLDALVVTPTRLSEVVLAKGILGFALAIAMALATLWLNGALTAGPWALIVVLLVAGLLLVEVGLVYGTASKDVTGVFTLIKGTGFILLAPTVFYIFPDWPQWIAKLFPTYWVIDPVYQVTINGAGLGDVRGDLLIAMAVIVAMVVPIRWLTHRLETKLALAA